MNKQTPKVIEPDQSIVNTPGSNAFDVPTAMEHLGRGLLFELNARNIAFSRENSYVKFEAGARSAKCWVVLKLEPGDEYSIEFHRVDNRLFRTVRGERVLNETFGRLTRLALHERIPLESLREIIRDHFA